MSSVWRISCVAAPLVLAACGADEPTVPITSVTPSRAYSDDPVSIALGGNAFRPGLAIDTTGGGVAFGGGTFAVTLVSADARLPASSVRWIDPYEIDATLPAGAGAGSYDVELRDPRGNTTVRQGGFTSLGPDEDAPAVTFTAPAAGAMISPRGLALIQIAADDGLGHLQRIDATVSSDSLGTTPATCLPPIAGAPPRGACAFTVMAPSALTPIETITVDAVATDQNGNQGTTTLALDVVWVPGLAGVVPDLGPTAGGTDILVKGSNFINGISRVLVDGQPLEPDGGVFINDHTMSGTTPAHTPGTAGIVVVNGPGKSVAAPFAFIAPPALRSLFPGSGAASASTGVTLAGDNFRIGATTVAIADSDGNRQPIDGAIVVSAYRIDFTIPPGSGSLSIVVTDPVSGEAELPAAFSYTADPAPPDGGPPP